MTITETRQVDFVAALKIPGDATLPLSEIAARFEEAVVEVISTHPAIGAYFVQPIDELHEVQVGLRFEDVSPDYVEGWAEDLVAEAFELFKRSRGLGRAANLKREDSSLVVG